MEHVRPVEEDVSKTVTPARVSRVQVLGAPPIFTTPDSSIAERPAYIRLTGERYLLGRPFLHSSLRSSIAEHPPDKRKTVARYHAEGPQGCVAETDQRPVEGGKRSARYRLQPPLSRHWCNSSTRLFQRQSAGASPAWRTAFYWLPKCKSPARGSAKTEAQGASPCGSATFQILRGRGRNAPFS